MADEPLNRTDESHTPRRQGRRPTTKIAWLIVLAVTILIAAVTALLGIATLVPGLGLLSTAAALLAPSIAPVLTVIGLAVLIIAIVALRRGLRRSGITAAALGGIGLITNVVAVAILVNAFSNGGGSVNLISATFGLSGIGSATPDRTEVYGKNSTGGDLSVSVYEPSEKSGAAPTVMFVHGGGWTTGEPDKLSTELRSLADDGYLVISVQYELATTSNPTWNKAPAQVACAASWIAANATRLNADMTRLAYWGESAGGNLVVNTAGAAAQGTVQSACGGIVPIPAAVVTDFPGVNVTSLYNNPFDVAGISTRNFARTYTGGSPDQYPQRYAAVNSATYLSPRTPQTLVMTPTRDDLVDPDDEYAWADAARKQGARIEVVKIPLANHAYAQFFKNSLGSQGHLSIAKRYLAQHLK